MLRYKHLVRDFLIGMAVGLVAIAIWMNLDAMAQNFLAVVAGSLVIYAIGLVLLHLIAFGVVVAVDKFKERV